MIDCLFKTISSRIYYLAIFDHFRGDIFHPTLAPLSTLPLFILQGNPGPYLEAAGKLGVEQAFPKPINWPEFTKTMKALMQNDRA